MGLLYPGYTVVFLVLSYEVVCDYNKNIQPEFFFLGEA